MEDFPTSLANVEEGRMRVRLEKGNRDILAHI
jgi:hypothetical protein